MADNTTLPGTGDVIAADDVSGVKYQIVKVGFGALDTATLVASGTGLPVDSELPAAAALADGTANPTAPLVGAANETWNGTTWDRAKSAAAAANTTGTGLPGSGVLGYDGTNYQLVKVSTAGVQHVLPAFTELASLTAGALNADLVPSTDVSAYKSISVQVVGTWSGSLGFQGSNDNSTWVAYPAQPSGTASPSQQLSISSNAIYIAPVNFRYFRVRMTAYTSGTATGVCELSSAPTQFPTVNVASITTVSGTVTVQGTTSSPTDASTNATNTVISNGYGSAFNGTSWDRQRNNMDVAVLASAARTTTQTGADTTNYNGRGIKVVLDTTAATSGSVTLTIQGKDANGVYYTILAGAAVTTVSTNVYTVYPGAPATANVSANDFLPRTYRVVVTANNATAQTYSVSSCVIL